MQDPGHLFDDQQPLDTPPSPPPRLLLKVPAPTNNNMAVPQQPPRRSLRHKSASDDNAASGSEYHASEKSYSEGTYAIPESPPIVEYATTSRGRRIAKKSYKESGSEDDLGGLGDPNLFADDTGVVEHRRRSRRGMSNGAVAHDGDDEDDEEEQQPRYPSRKSTRNLPDFIEEDEDSKMNEHAGYSTRSKSRKPSRPAVRQTRNSTRPASPRRGPSARELRMKRRRAKDEAEDVYVDNDSSNNSADADGSLEDAPHTSSELDPEPEPEIIDQELGDEIEADGRPYALRQRAKINYAIPTLDEAFPTNNAKGKSRSGPKKGKIPWNMSGHALGRMLGEKPGNDSDSDYDRRSPRKQPFATPGAGAFAGSGMLPSDFAAAAGTPSNLGKVGDAALADADPLGTNVNVTFDEVGGLDDHIHALKEMTLLPLLYPEVFKQFNVTPPRGVLFHGPPGTGKTLLARALAASCRADGKQISFFMRKGADCLSKWVGEAERQLRLLFEEAKNCQPSIIFFDEIDGLAPVRSSKQDQIHASIVSTLLALMDGMDGRGQVVIIGATNRPDAVDPALRRPGRFDREFYFPLPKIEAREKILRIMTKGWNGWDSEKGEEYVKGLSKMTKGYGGADLRALCTEASLNAIQRRYPQIYKSKERLLLAPETIQVGMRDFMISIKKLVPSSARSSSSAANPLPPQFEPLLSDILQKAKDAVDKVLPMEKKLTALEEAEYDDDDSLEHELLTQSMATLRVYRPRIVLHGPVGMGQVYVGAAILHHLEGYHIQSLELGTLMGDSTRTVEAAIVQLFVEAKRHQPSVIYIPALLGWCAAVSEASRSTVRAMLDTLSPTDPILLVAVLDGEFSSLPRDVKSWFGHPAPGSSKDNRIRFSAPALESRAKFFASLIDDVKRPPNKFPDGVKRRKRILEELPIAPPLEPRKPTQAELALQEENDRRTLSLLQNRLLPVLTELRRKFKRFTKSATEEYNFNADDMMFPPIVEQPPPVPQPEQEAPVNEVGDAPPPEVTVNGVTEHPETAPEQSAQPPSPMQVEPPPEEPILYDMDLDKISVLLYNHRYLTPTEFFEDILKIVHNARVRVVEDNERFHKAQAMLMFVDLNIKGFESAFSIECERMADRERERMEQRRKKKGQSKEPTPAPAPRRSTRQNGPLDIKITDPTALERRLKRQRSEDGAGGDSNGGSEGEQQAAKRSKLSSQEAEDRAEQQQQMAVRMVTPPRTSVVRFAPEEEGFQTMPPLGQRRPPPQVEGQVVSAAPDDQNMIVDVETSPRKSGFDPFLLNPAPPHLNGTISLNGALDLPSLLSQPYQQPEASSSTSQIPVPILRAPSRSRTPIATPPFEPPHDPTVAVGPNDPFIDAAMSQPMQIERTPSPPLPDFHVDEGLLARLEALLRDKTDGLNVEQLEQLRASCLGTIWRHRQEWDRDVLVRELTSMVEEFVEEVRDCLDEEHEEI